MLRTGLGYLFISPVYIIVLWHIALENEVMTGLSLELQLFMCDLSISCISSESSGHPTSSRCGRTLTFYNSERQVFQERKTGSRRSVCLSFQSLVFSVEAWAYQ